MNLTAINKAIDLLQSGNLAELENLLTFEKQTEILKSKGKSEKLAKVIERVLKNNAKERPILCTVMHDKDDKQYIVNGFIGVKWHKHKEELDGLPQTAYSTDLVDFDSLVPRKEHCSEWVASEDEKLILSKLYKYRKIHTSREPIYLFDRFFDSELLSNFVKIVGSFDKVYYSSKNELTPIYVYKDDLSAVILPLRIIGKDTKESVTSRTNEFLSLLKGE